jgi:ABC-type amino acid transport substrate-binding protein
MPPLQSAGPPRPRATAAACAIALLATSPLVLAQAPAAPAPAASAAPAPAGTLDRVRAAGRIKIGYRTDARPFSYGDQSGQPAGYSIDLCQRIVATIKSETRQTALTAEWVPVAAADRFRAVQQGQIDLLCGAETITLSRREQLSFSLPIFPGGIGALVRADAPVRLREVLSGRGQTFRPTWRASAALVLQSRSFTAVEGTTSEKWLADRIRDLQVIANVSRVPGYDAGIQALLDRQSDALFGERAILLDASRRHAAGRDLIVIDRLFTYEPVALAFARGDETFRRLVDRALSKLYGSGELYPLYTKWFAEPDESTLTFFRWNTLPE